MALSEWPDKFKRDDIKQDAIEVQIDAEVTAVTDRAVQLDGHLWLPKSQVPCLADAEVGDQVESIDIPAWLAKEKDLL